MRRVIFWVVIPLVVVLMLAGSIGFFFVAVRPLIIARQEERLLRESPKGDRPTPPLERVKNGGKIIADIGPKAAVIQISGFAAPSVRLVVQESKWRSLSHEAQTDVTYYMEGLIESVRWNPEMYLDIPRHAPLYRAAVAYAKKMCDDCWEIITGHQRQGTLFLDSTVVQGDSQWAGADPCCRGMKASTFRSVK